MSARSIAADVASGARSAASVLDEHLDRVAERDDEIHAFNLVTEDKARAQAEA
ncbi:MAG: hypothetical protein HOH36_09390, partial [Acidimicrobiaceae bacterium]|nr:hypothetical protein [Acidimicrobiaceae bacterium]